MGFFASHWRGVYSLNRAFWVNFVALRVAVYFVLSALLGFDFIPFAAFLAVVCADAGLFAWQAVGLVRAGETHVAGHGSLVPVWGTYLAIVVTLFVFSPQWLGLYQRTILKPYEEPYADKMARLRAATYKLTLSSDDATLTLDGDIALGATGIIGRMLDEKGSVRSLTLNSSGGNIYEARGIARLVRTNGLDTRVEGECSSACTIIFISGRTRTMAETAKLGFHQYRLDTTALIPNVEIAAEQARDRALFEGQAIDGAFLDRIFNSPSSEIWYPDREELRAAGVIPR
ncbi:MAG: hypothetical protein KDJ90_15110 [Nitratireductor sp.]|nr:hypothetical protein [Nitratireductor sp.]